MCACQLKSTIATSILVELASFLQFRLDWRVAGLAGRRSLPSQKGSMISPIVDHSQPAMRWPPWESKESKESKEIDLIKWPEILNATDWAHYTDARNVVPVVLLTSTALGSYAFYRSYLRRIPQAGLIGPRFWRKRSLFGRVTSVGDGDNFRLFHTPGGILAGWGWLPGRKIPKKRSKDQTVGAYNHSLKPIT